VPEQGDESAGLASAAADPARVTALLGDWRRGDAAARDRLLALLYADLHRLAARAMRQERSVHTLQATALLHEAYLKLQQLPAIRAEDRGHLLRFCAQVMRQVLIDHARTRARAKRDGGERVTLGGWDDAGVEAPLDVLALDQALAQLAAVDARKAQLVELKVFGGLDHHELEQVLGVSRATLDRDWRAARAWLADCLAEPGEQP
jgi:RNA polymerase sigma factor (TIGR02999 family)